jgi:hypothetical protein
MGYQLGTHETGREWIQCTACGHRSFHAQDVARHYCPRCAVFHDDLAELDRLQGDLQAIQVAVQALVLGVRSLELAIGHEPLGVTPAGRLLAQLREQQVGPSAQGILDHTNQSLEQLGQQRQQARRPRKA